MKARGLFVLCVVALTAEALWPLWTLRLLPMQDYPQHLYLTQILTTWNDATLDWKDHYQLNLGLRPYMLWFLVMKPLATVVTVETAGRIVFSLSVLITAGLVLRARRDAPEGFLPWGALLLFPFSFHQSYFMGFTNYIVSIPILFLAVLHLESFGRSRPGPAQIGWHALLLIILFLNHPYTVLVYMGLAFAGALSLWGNRAAIVRVLTPTAALAVAFSLWYLLGHEQPRNAANAAAWTLRWLTFRQTVGYYFMIFTDMRWRQAPSFITAALWLVTFGLFLGVWRNRDGLRHARWPFFLFVAATAGFFALPFWLSYYSFFNARLAPVVYFALALTLGRLPLRPAKGVALAVLAAIVMAFSIRTQGAVSKESEEILPIAAHVEKNAAILPLMFDSSTEAVDPWYFYQMHSHEVAYCHLASGGGVDPDLFASAMLPVQYKEGFYLPYPEDPGQFNGSQHAKPYEYFLTRGAPDDLLTLLGSHTDEIARSGKWVLFRKRRG